MEDRRAFLKKSTTLAAVGLSCSTLPGCVHTRTIRAKVPMKTKKTEKALVLWYSQTGYTARNGRLLAKTLEINGIKVTSSEIRLFDKKGINDFDLIVMGSPVFYYDTPMFVKNWIASLPALRGTPVATYVTFGGPEGNQHNAACSILEQLAEKEGVPIGIDSFMNMASYPLAWSEEQVSEKTWMSRHLPNEETYEKVRQYARELINRVALGKPVEFSKKLTLREISTYLGPVWWTKQLVKNHILFKEKCIRCGTCVAKCPVNAINLSNYTINTESCVLCFGCINNCPVQAVNMEYNGKKVMGYNEFMKRKHLKIKEPEELIDHPSDHKLT
ncbi:MAG: 4Fe-4S binding protein [Deltaproteobacteria bacterium]|nr:4Fe-4S binding protein [Deltaproteobacteria bacterium]